ncbi:MAG: LysR family transcriptional regulator [Rhodovulum sulfidophilum]|uniref:LysR family transcriptional regulator n=1 Tax=Rhodovulum sulfidophilum TaxID=35806 RepID=A0A2W5QH77_RHOSU|nr:MAG: LysR family transcriptional regulator [Rhodovulum sulfidophilum]
MRFDLDDLRLFLAVAEAGSITHGAAGAGLSLPAASERLRRMELSGGVRLLERGRRGATPTEAGEAVLRHARLILRQSARLRGEIGAFAGRARGSVRLFANTAAMTEFLPERIAPWLAARPEVDIALEERQSADIARSVLLGFAEIGVLSAAVETEGLTLAPFAIDRLVVVSARDHPFAAARRIRFAELCDAPFLALAEGALRDHLDAQAARIGLRLRPRVRLRGFEDICRMAGAGIGVGVVPETAARRCRGAARIAVTRLAEDWAARRLAGCVPEAPTPLARDLFAHLAGTKPASSRPGAPERA